MSKEMTFCPIVRNNIQKLVKSNMLDAETVKEWENADKIETQYNLLLRQANNGEVQAMYMLAMGHLNGVWLDQVNYTQAFKLFSRGSECECGEGNIWQLRCMAARGVLMMECLTTSSQTTAKALAAKAFALLHFASARRNAYATFRLADYYYLGKGTLKNVKKALEMYEAGVVYAREIDGMYGVAEWRLQKALATIEEIKSSHLVLRSRIVCSGDSVRSQAFAPDR